MHEAHPRAPPPHVVRHGQRRKDIVLHDAFSLVIKFFFEFHLALVQSVVLPNRNSSARPIYRVPSSSK